MPPCPSRFRAATSERLKWLGDNAENPGRKPSAGDPGLEKAGFQIVRQGKKHVVMSDGPRFLTIPRSNPINAFTMGGIARDAGLSIEQFGKLLK